MPTQLPGVSVSFQNGNLGLVDTPEDGIFAVVGSCDVSGTNLTAGVAISVTSMDQLLNDHLLTDTIVNHEIYSFFQDFFSEAGTGNKIWFLPIPKDFAMSEQFQGTADWVKSMCDASNSEISAIFTVWDPDGTITLADDNGVDEDVWELASSMQSFTEGYIVSNAAPMFGVIQGYNYTGELTLLPDLADYNFNRVQIFLGGDQAVSALGFKGCTYGRYAGSLAKNGVAVNPGRVKNGPLYDQDMFIAGGTVEQFDVASLHGKGYVTFRKHLGKSGYFITDCPMACDPTDDYSKLTRRRVIDKAFRIAFQIASEEVLEDFNISSAGTIDPIYAKQIESNVMNALYQGMTLNAELSADLSDPNDKGCIAKIDLSYPTGQSGTISFSALQVRVRGEAELISVPLGFISLNS